MEINGSDSGNITLLHSNIELSDGDVQIIVFLSLVGVLVCSIPCLIGKNGRIRSREWFNRRT